MYFSTDHIISFAGVWNWTNSQISIQSNIFESTASISFLKLWHRALINQSVRQSVIWLVQCSARQNVHLRPVLISYDPMKTINNLVCISVDFGTFWNLQGEVHRTSIANFKVFKILKVRRSQTLRDTVCKFPTIYWFCVRVCGEACLDTNSWLTFEWWYFQQLVTWFRVLV